MKQITVGLFDAREDAERALRHLQNELKITPSDISYVYRNTEGETKEVQADDVTLSTSTTGEGAVGGAMVGGAVGALAGVATIVGLIPVVGPIFAAGPLIAALGIGGAAGTVAAGAATGAAAGGLIGALMNLGMGEERARIYEDRVKAGNILVTVHADESVRVSEALLESGATEVESYALKP